MGTYSGPPVAKAFVMYAAQLLRRRAEEQAYRNYVCDVLMAAYGANVRYHDLVHPTPDFDPAEVVEGVMRKLGQEV